ncbi:formimidoylglutamase [Zhouia amylolytica]|uniref:Formiminoglutamate hydrolase n=1 Tax=Zhouia amylolytica AD3 TaxID=1286632 RepID=W2UPF8_9FLAO|nr:formimidoylglutamase [Zhouia amylolytica]ETN95361.1 formiminoglutamate hydrolase [Zhouia amylolytica AD3]
MSKYLITYQLKTINKYIGHRKGEVKIGEKFKFINDPTALKEELTASKTKHVILGIPEDYGVQANYGRPGAKSAWTATLKSLLNVQQNKFNKGGKILLLGHLDFSKEVENVDFNSPELPKKLQNVINIIDKEITYLINLIVSSGKTPIIIGGGHNNAYGILKGCALAHGKPVNVINIDAHTDFRTTETRHSGNGFSYAFEEGFLNKYFIFGLHENYTSKEIFNMLNDEDERIQYNTFESLVVRKETEIIHEAERALSFVEDDFFGLEIDCDSIINIPSSAMTPSGLSVNDIRYLTHKFSRSKNIQYVHICEAAPNPKLENEMILVGKLISYLITDFIRK